ncbi:MAG: hypothetical protein KDK07_08135 [Bauldia sp.]|nr:hypothetical protein [Bauldia sp.]
MKKMLVLAAAMAAMPVLAQAEEWFVVREPDMTCAVADTVLPGYGKMAGPFASEAEAEAHKKSIAACEKVNTDPDPDNDGPAPAR